MEPLNSTAACVLGLLQLGPAPGQSGHPAPRGRQAMTGWQLSEAAKVSVSRFWNLTRSQIYRELSRLERQRLVVAAGAAGPRASRPYRVTASGKRAFRAWMEAFTAREPRDEQLRSPLVLTVFFGEFLPPATLRRVLAEHRARHERRLAGLRSMSAALGSSAGRLPAAVLRRGMAYQELVIRWLDELTTGRRG